MKSKYEYRSTLSVANVCVTVRCQKKNLFDQLRKRYQAFLSSGEPRLSVDINIDENCGPYLHTDRNPIYKEGSLIFVDEGFRGNIDVKAGSAQLWVSPFETMEAVEYFLRAIYALLFFQAGGMLFHGAGIIHNHRAYLFFGHSGSGKTTIARFSADDVILNDDLVVLMPEPINSSSTRESWMVYSTPFWNPTQISPTLAGAPLVGMFNLKQDKDVYLEQMSQGQALAEIVSNIPLIPLDGTKNEIILERCLRLQFSVPVFRLHFLPNTSFWRVVEQIR